MCGKERGVLEGEEGAGFLSAGRCPRTCVGRVLSWINEIRKASNTRRHLGIGHAAGRAARQPGSRHVMRARAASHMQAKGSRDRKAAGRSAGRGRENREKAGFYQAACTPASPPMPDSPRLDDAPASPAPSPASLAHSSNAQLAALLADALRDAESLRRELAATKKRADDIERRYHALSSLSDPKSSLADTSRVIQDFEQRALDAEAARDDSDARRRLVVETWHQLDRYLQTVEMRAADARAGFSKIVAEGGGHVVFNAIPVPGGGPVSIPYPPLGTMPPPNHARTPYPSAGRPSPLGHRSGQSQSSFPLALPPHPTPNGNGRRPRDDSLDGSGYVDSLPGQPPSKKLKGFGDDRRGRDERTAYSESVRTSFPLVTSQTHHVHRILLICINVTSPYPRRRLRLVSVFTRNVVYLRRG